MFYGIIGIILAISLVANWIQYRKLRRRQNILIKSLCVIGILFLLFGQLLIPVLSIVFGFIFLFYCSAFCMGMFQYFTNRVHNESDEHFINVDHKRTCIQKSE